MDSQSQGNAIDQCPSVALHVSAQIGHGLVQRVPRVLHVVAEAVPACLASLLFFLRRSSVKLRRIRTGVRRDNVEKSMFFDAFDLILLVVDELVDGGCVSKHCPF